VVVKHTDAFVAVGAMLRPHIGDRAKASAAIEWVLDSVNGRALIAFGVEILYDDGVSGVDI
jgi:hypothetical protein